jgi:hypothetical protein
MGCARVHPMRCLAGEAMCFVTSCAGRKWGALYHHKRGSMYEVTFEMAARAWWCCFTVVARWPSLEVRWWSPQDGQR